MASEVVEWIDAFGETTILDVDWNVSGRFMPPVTLLKERVPQQHGARPRGVRHETRPFTLALWIPDVDEEALRAQLRELVGKMDPTRGAGKIRVTSPIGDQREIECFYSKGLEMEEVIGSMSGPNVQRANVEFEAMDPYWTDSFDRVTEFTIDDNGSTWFPGPLPLDLSSSQVVFGGDLTNGGDVATWPQWTITGPGGVIRLRNLSTGESFDMKSTYTLGVGETLLIDTRPGYRSVMLDDGTNMWPQVDVAASHMWPLDRGSTTVRLEMSGATTGSALAVVGRWRYLSP